MSYAAASEPAPAVGTDNSPTFFKAMFDMIFATFNANDTIITAATDASTAGALVKRNATTGNVGVGSVSAKPLSNSAVAAVFAQAFNATTQNLWIGQSSSGVTTSVIDSTGAAQLVSLALTTTPLAVGSGGSGKASVTAGAILLGNGTAAMTEMVGAATGQVPVWGGSAWAAGGIGASSIGDSLPTPGAAGQINVAAQKSYVDVNGQIVPNQSAAVATLPTQPTGTNFQYVGISRAPGTGSLTVTAGTLGAAESALVMPQGNDPIASVLWPGVTTLPSGIVPAANIRDVRGPRYGLGTAGGGTFAGTVAALTAGDVTATYPNTKDVTNAATTLAIHPTLTRQTTATASLTDLLTGAATGNLYAALVASGATLQCVGGANNKIALEVAGQWCVLATTATSNTLSGAAANYYIFADRTAATLTAQSLPANAFTLTLATSPSPSATQRLLGSVRFDGTAVRAGSPSSTQYGLLDLRYVGTGYQPRGVVNSVLSGSTAVTTTSALTTAVGTNLIVYTPVAAWMRYDALIDFATPSLVGLQMAFALGDNTGTTVQAGNTDEMQVVATSTSQDERRTYVGMATLAPGNHILNLYARCVQGSQSFAVTLVRLNAEIFAS